MTEVTQWVTDRIAERTQHLGFLRSCTVHMHHHPCSVMTCSWSHKRSWGPVLAHFILGASGEELLFHSPYPADNDNLHTLIYLRSTWIESLGLYFMYLHHSPTTPHSHQPGVHVWGSGLCIKCICQHTCRRKFNFWSRFYIWLGFM